tara:strand:+ start:211 stop:1173 length:963 start_codon:yes stop_codon:yes gene_type:complete
MLNLQLRKLFSSALYKTFLCKFKTNNVIALDYHYFTNSNIKIPGLEVSYSILDRQLNLFSTLFDPQDTIYCLKNLGKNINKNKKQKIMISIDDADRSVIKALHYFQKYKIPVVIFVPIGIALNNDDLNGKRSKILCRYKELFPANNKISLNDKEKFFNKIINADINQLKEYEIKLGKPDISKNITSTRNLLSIKELEKISKNPLFTIASHSMSHNCLSELPDKWLLWEIKKSSEYIRDLGGNEKLFAYPFGHKNSYNKKVQKTLQKEGIKYSFSTSSIFINEKSNYLQLGRAPMLNFSQKSYVCGSACGAFHYWDKILNR